MKKYILLLVCFLPFFLVAQQNNSFTKNGITFGVITHIGSEIKPSVTGAGYPVWSIGNITSNVTSANYNYKGKTYTTNSFNGQLANAFRGVKVVSLRIVGEASPTTFDGVNKTDACFSAHESHGNSVTDLKKGATHTFTSRIVGICEIEGLDFLHDEIDRLQEIENEEMRATAKTQQEREERDQYLKNQQNNFNQTANTKTDYWGEPKTTSATTSKNDEAAAKNAKINASNTKMSNAFADMAKGDKDAAMQKAREAYQLNPSETNKKNLEVLTKEYNSQVKYEVNQQLTNEIMKDANLSTLHGENGALATASKGLGATLATGQINEGLITGGLSAILLGNAEAKAKREEQARRIAEQKRLEEEIRQKRLLLRNQVISAYQNVELPKSTTKIETNTIYCFIYAIDNDNIDKSAMKVFISNAPFEIKKYSDGTWPYKKDIAQKATNISPFNEMVAGYWTTYDEALNALEQAITTFKNSDANITLVSFEYSKSSASSNEMDYWNKTEKTNQPKTKTETDKYWDK